MTMENNNLGLVVSIITPNYNREKYLEKTIQSIISQKDVLIEHVVVDGASTDGSLDILKKYEGKYNLKWISEKDNGCADAMEKGFLMATGDIFCWLDSDDIFLPDTLKKVVKIFKSRKEVDVVFGNMFICDRDDRIIDYVKRTTFDADAMIYLGMIMSPQATFWRKSLHRNLHGIDRTYLRCADYDFFCRMGLAGAKFYHINDYLAVYRVHGEQLTKSVQLCQKEADEISKKYMDKSLSPKALMNKKRNILIRRAFYFLRQGDIWYALRSFLTRLGFVKAASNNENNTYQF